VNWLAHLRLAPQEPLLRLGNLAGDFVRGTDVALLHPTLRTGIAQHRALDRFTDAHPLVAAARRLVDPARGRFAGVLVDVFFDHFLASRWQRHGDGRPLRAFADEVYGDLERHLPLLPDRLRTAAPLMVAHDWLAAYATREGIAEILTRMARRSPRFAPVTAGIRDLGRAYEALGELFERFLPPAAAYAATQA
jgi:acyl carrier protein phosphodiesterase